MGLKMQKLARETKSVTVRMERNVYQDHTVRQQIKEQEKGTGTTAGRHNGGHGEARRAGDTAVPLCTRDFDILIQFEECP